jgi:hypothetical protein
MHNVGTKSFQGLNGRSASTGKGRPSDLGLVAVLTTEIVGSPSNEFDLMSRLLQRSDLLIDHNVLATW